MISSLETALFEPFEILRHSNRGSYRKQEEEVGSEGEFGVWVPNLDTVRISVWQSLFGRTDEGVILLVGSTAWNGCDKAGHPAWTHFELTLERTLTSLFSLLPL